MSRILIPATNIIPADYFYAEEPDDGFSHQFRVGTSSNTIVKRFIDTSGSYVSTLISPTHPDDLGFGLPASIDNDPDNSFICIGYGTGVIGTDVYWVFDESALGVTPFLKSKPRGLYIKSDTAFFDTDSSNYTIYQLGRGVEEISVSGVAPALFYGDGTAHASGIATYPGTGDNRLYSKQTLMVYSADAINNTFRFNTRSIGNAHPNTFIQELIYGVLYTLPTNEVYDRTTGYTYGAPTIQYTELGKPITNGFHSTKIKRKLALKFDYLTSDEVGGLRDIFLAGRGGLPMLYIQDDDDTDTWIYCTIPNMTIEEPIPCYFDVTFTLEEI